MPIDEIYMFVRDPSQDDEQTLDIGNVFKPTLGFKFIQILTLRNKYTKTFATILIYIS